jgi:DNA-binding NtrC family response regulator
MTPEPYDTNFERFGHYVVLVVDDDADLLDAARTTLESDQRIRVLTTLGAADAQEILARETIDLVITDQKMPGTSGLGLLAIMREKHPRVARAMLTGEADVAIAVQAINDGHIAAFFQKPIKRTELLGKVLEILRGRQDALDKERGVENTFDALRRGLASTGKDPGRPFTGRLRE